MHYRHFHKFSFLGVGTPCTDFPQSITAYPLGVGGNGGGGGGAHQLLAFNPPSALTQLQNGMWGNTARNRWHPLASQCPLDTECSLSEVLVGRRPGLGVSGFPEQILLTSALLPLHPFCPERIASNSHIDNGLTQNSELVPSWALGSQSRTLESPVPPRSVLC
jgi:hypothetical protein